MKIGQYCSAENKSALRLFFNYEFSKPPVAYLIATAKSVLLINLISKLFALL